MRRQLGKRQSQLVREGEGGVISQSRSSQAHRGELRWCEFYGCEVRGKAIESVGTLCIARDREAHRAQIVLVALEHAQKGSIILVCRVADDLFADVVSGQRAASLCEVQCEIDESFDAVGHASLPATHACTDEIVAVVVHADRDKQIGRENETRRVGGRASFRSRVGGSRL